MNIKIFSHWIEGNFRSYTGFSPVLYAFECDENNRPIREIGFATECGQSFYTTKLKPILDRSTENRVWAKEYLNMLRERNDCETQHLMEQIQPTKQEN